MVILPTSRRTHISRRWHVDHFKIISLLQFSTNLKVCTISVIHSKFLTIVWFLTNLQSFYFYVYLDRISTFSFNAWLWSLMVPQHFYFFDISQETLGKYEIITHLRKCFTPQACKGKSVLNNWSAWYFMWKVQRTFLGLKACKNFVDKYQSVKFIHQLHVLCKSRCRWSKMQSSL